MTNDASILDRTSCAPLALSALLGAAIAIAVTVASVIVVIEEIEGSTGVVTALQVALDAGADGTPVPAGLEFKDSVVIASSRHDDTVTTGPPPIHIDQ